MTEETIPAIQRYEIDCGGNAIKQVEDGPWVRYDDHVASMELMQLSMKKLEQETSQWKEMFTKSVHLLELQEKQITYLKTRRN
jgi:hypothetical protein